MVLKVSIYNPFNGEVVAVLDVVKNFSVFCVMQSAGLNPYLYHILDSNNNKVCEESMKHHILVADKGTDPPATILQIVARDRDLEVQWYITSTMYFSGQVVRCEHALPTVYIDNEKPKLDDALKRLIPKMLPEYDKLRRLIQQNIEGIASIRKRKLDVARRYDHERCCWVLHCMFVLDYDHLAFRLKFRGFQVATGALEKVVTATIMRAVDDFDI